MVSLRSSVRRQLPFLVDKVTGLTLKPQKAVVITGFWRSGTTWFQRMLADALYAKTIFEPLEADVQCAYFARYGTPIAFPSKAFLKAYMPVIEEPLVPGSAWYHLFADALSGSIQGKRVRMNRTGLSEAFRRRVVVKLVRGHLAVWGLKRTFGPMLVHVYRDPRTVLTSIVRNKWGGEWLNSISLHAYLVAQQRQGAIFFTPWLDMIEYYDQQSYLARLTAYWALTEAYIENCAHQHAASDLLVSYESLLLQREETLANITSLLGAKFQSGIQVADKISPTTVAGREMASINDRLVSWKQELTFQEISLIEETVCAFGLEHRLTQG